MEHRCIYCGSSEDLSESDIIPDALTNARIYNKNVCRIAHNNKFSDMFESNVIKALAYITNKLNIKSSKGKKYASYDAIIKIRGVEYNVFLQGDHNLFDGRVIKSTDKTNMISSYEKLIEIAGHRGEIEHLDINNLEIEKTVRVNNEIFFDQSMYRMISKIAFEWYCAKNNIVGYHQEFDNVITFITTGNGNNPVSIVQNEKTYDALSEEVELGSHTLFAFETANGEINVVISLFGLMMYRVILAKSKSELFKKNFLYAELRTDSARIEIEHKSIIDAEKYLFETLNSDKFQLATESGGKKFMIPKDPNALMNLHLYTFVFEMIRRFNEFCDDINEPNDIIYSIFYKQLNNILKETALHMKSIKRFVNDHFPDGHDLIQLNPAVSNKKDILFFFVVFLIGLSFSPNDKLDERSLQLFLKEKLPLYNGQKMIVSDEVEQDLKKQIMGTNNYSDILENGARIIKSW